MALWDATAKLERRPLYQVLATRYGDGLADRSVPVYAAGGYYYPGKDVSALKAEMRSYLDAGYTTVKMKIGGATLAEDRDRIEAVLTLLPSGDRLCVDANGRFDFPSALEYARALEPYNLKWYEEPGDPLDFKLLTEVAAASKTPIATGENLFSTQDSRNLIRYGGLNPRRDFLQMDPALSLQILASKGVTGKIFDNKDLARDMLNHQGHEVARRKSKSLEPWGGCLRRSQAFGVGSEFNAVARRPRENGRGVGVTHRSGDAVENFAA